MQLIAGSIGNKNVQRAFNIIESDTARLRVK